MSFVGRRSFYVTFLSMALMGMASAYGATKWTQPTAAELQMTSDAAAPGADAVILNRYEIVDFKQHYHSVYERIKVLTAAGAKYGTITIPWEEGTVGEPTLTGRTIEPDGKVVAYAGTPELQTEWVAGGYREKRAVFTMPDVKAGSIVEFLWRISYNHDWAELPTWRLQQPLYMHEAHYRYEQTSMTDSSDYYEVGRTAPGVPMSPFNWVWRNPTLPSNWKFVQNGPRVDLETTAVPPSVPMDAEPAGYLGQYWLEFFYPSGGSQLESLSPPKFWKMGGRNWLNDLKDSAKPGGMKDVVAQLTAGSTTPMEKLEKIYAAVMTMQNIHAALPQPYVKDLPQRSLEMGRQTLNGTVGVGWTAAGVWKKHKGTSEQIAGVFVAMVEAAGMKAEPVLVGDRELRAVDWGLPQWNQLRDEIVVVTVNGQKMFFDPAEPYCAFGQLKWNHYRVAGLMPLAKGGVGAIATPEGNYKNNQLQRDAVVTVAANGGVTGTIQVTMTGAEALRWRQEALRYGEPVAAEHFSEELEAAVPAGVTVKTEQFGALTDSTKPLTASVTLGGTLGELKAGAKIPSEFLMAREKPLFLAKTRTAMVDLKWPYLARDQVQMTLPAGYSVTGMPKGGGIPYPGHADAITNYSVHANVYHVTRLVAMAQTLYAAADYPKLRSFYRAMQERDAAAVTLEKQGQ